MVWCDQVRKRIARVLLEIGNGVGGRGRQERLVIAKEWFVGESRSRVGEPDKAGKDGIELARKASTELRGEEWQRFSIPQSSSHLFSFPVRSFANSTFQLITSSPISASPSISHTSPDESSMSIFHCLRTSSSSSPFTACIPLSSSQLNLMPPSHLLEHGKGVEEGEGLTFFESIPIEPRTGRGSSDEDEAEVIVVRVGGGVQEEGWAIGRVREQGREEKEESGVLAAAATIEHDSVTIERGMWSESLIFICCESTLAFRHADRP
jgi:hypothetical protein